MSFLILLDLEKAFELADPPSIAAILAEKGVKGKLLGWIEDYLTNRRASLKFKGQISRHAVSKKHTPRRNVKSHTF